MSKCKYRVS